MAAYHLHLVAVSVISVEAVHWVADGFDDVMDTPRSGHSELPSLLPMLCCVPEPPVERVWTLIDEDGKPG